MQQQTASSLPPGVSRILPTRGAAVTLLVLDVALLMLPLIVRWQTWFAFAYVPLLITVVLGVLMSGWGKWVIVAVGFVTLSALASLWIALRLPSADVDRIDAVLRIGMIALSCVCLASVGVAAWGWSRFFRGRPATRD